MPKFIVTAVIECGFETCADRMRTMCDMALPCSVSDSGYSCDLFKSNGRPTPLDLDDEGGVMRLPVCLAMFDIEDADAETE